MEFPQLKYFPENALKRQLTATEAEIKQVTLAQLRYASDRAYDGGCRNNARGTK